MAKHQITTRIELQKVIDATCEICSVTEADLSGRRRDARMSLCRQMLILVARSITKASFPEIGLRLGRHYTSVMEAEDTARDAAVQNLSVAMVVNRIAARACELAGVPAQRIVSEPMQRASDRDRQGDPAPTLLGPEQRAELVRLKDKGWSRGGLSRRYGISERQVEIEYKAETGRAIAA